MRLLPRTGWQEAGSAPSRWSGTGDDVRVAHGIDGIARLVEQADAQDEAQRFGGGFGGGGFSGGGAGGGW